MIEWFTPGYKAGGPIQSCVNVAYALKDAYDIYVLTTDTDHGEKEPYPTIESDRWIDDPTGAFKIFYAKKKGLTLNRLKQTILEIAPDYLYLNLLFAPYFSIYPLWLSYLGLLKSKVIVCPRGTLYDSALAVKPYKKKPFIKLFRGLGIHKRIRFHATNQREEQAIEKFFPTSKIVIADNLPNMNQPHFEGCEKKEGELKCIFIARIVSIKNLMFLLEVLREIKSKVLLTVIGPAEDKQYWNECEKKIAVLPSHIQVEYQGAKQNNELGAIMRQHHLFVLPTEGENFGHSIFESLLCGRPVLISDQTPWLKLAEKKIGWDLPLKKTDGFRMAIEEAAGWNQDRFDEYAKNAWQYAHDFISNPDLHKQYFQLFS